MPRSDGLNGERAAILQALGRHDEAFPIRQEAATLRSSFETLGALAGLCAERGEIETAEQMFLESQRCYRGVSPFPLAILNFQRGLMWKNNGRLDDARLSFDVARFGSKHGAVYLVAKGSVDLDPQLNYLSVGALYGVSGGVGVRF